MDQNLWRECKSYLSFRDLCAIRPVCKEWMDIRSDPHRHLVYYFADGSFVDLPDSRDPQFRKCLLAANLTKLHCQIFGWSDLDFVIQLLPSIEELTFEIDGCDLDNKSTLVNWDGSILYKAKKLKKLELIVTEFEPKFTIDFAAFPNLISFDSNVEVRLENYDNRMMDCMGLANTDFVKECIQIAKHTKLYRMSQRAGGSAYLNQYLNMWTKDPKMLPQFIQMHRGGMTFFHFSKVDETLTAVPIFGVRGAQAAEFMSVYRRALRIAFELFPNHKFDFHPQCDEQTKKTWLSIVNPIRERTGIAPLKLENFSTTATF